MKIAIVGAGPVGLFSAICLAQDKHEIHLYEKSTLPIDKACGEGLLHLGVKLLKMYDLEVKKAKPIRGLSFYSPKGHLKKASFLDSTGLGIRRLHLSESLLKYVKKHPNITLFERTKIDHPLKDYDFTIYATGASKDGMKKILPYNRLALRQHFKGELRDDFVQVYFSHIGEAYVTPIDQDCFQIALLLFKNKISNFKGGFLDYMNYFPSLKKNLNINTPIGDIRGTDQFGLKHNSPSSQKHTHIGDARIFLDGITGEGLSFGFYQAHILAKHLRRDSFNPKGFDKSLKPIEKKYQFFCHLMLIVSYFNCMKVLFFSLPNKLIHFLTLKSLLK